MGFKGICFAYGKNLAPTRQGGKSQEASATTSRQPPLQKAQPDQSPPPPLSHSIPLGGAARLASWARDPTGQRAVPSRAPFPCLIIVTAHPGHLGPTCMPTRLLVNTHTAASPPPLRSKRAFPARHSTKRCITAPQDVHCHYKIDMICAQNSLSRLLHPATYRSALGKKRAHTHTSDTASTSSTLSKAVTDVRKGITKTEPKRHQHVYVPPAPPQRPHSAVRSRRPVQAAQHPQQHTDISRPIMNRWKHPGRQQRCNVQQREHP